MLMERCIELRQFGYPAGLTGECGGRLYYSYWGWAKLQAINAMVTEATMSLMGQGSKIDHQTQVTWQILFSIPNQWHGHARTKAQRSKAASSQMGQTKVFMAGEPEFEDMKDQAQMFDQMHYLTKGFKIELKGLKNWMVRNVISSLWLTIKVRLQLNFTILLQAYLRVSSVAGEGDKAKTT